MTTSWNLKALGAGLAVSFALSFVLSLVMFWFVGRGSVVLLGLVGTALVSGLSGYIAAMIAKQHFIRHAVSVTVIAILVAGAMEPQTILTSPLLSLGLGCWGIAIAVGVGALRARQVAMHAAL